MIARLIHNLRQVHWAVLRRVWFHFGGLVRAEWKTLGLSVLGTFAVAICEVLQPWPLKIIFDFGLLHKNGKGMWTGVATFMHEHAALGLGLASLAIVLIAILDGLAGYLEAITMAASTQRVVYGIRARLFRHIQALSLDFHDESHSGDILMRLTGDINLMREMLAGVTISLGSTFVVFIGMTLVMAWMDPILTLAALFVVPILGIAVGRLSGQLKSAVSRQRKSEGLVAAAIHESLIGVRAIKAFGREREEERRFTRTNRKSLKEGMRARRLELALTRLVQILVACGTCAVVLLGARRVAAGRITPGDLLVFMAYTQKMYRPMSRISRLLAHLVKAVASGERVVEVLERTPTVVDAPDAVEAPAFRGRIEFDQVSFSYRPGERALRRISFAAEPGEVIALVGRTGAGKSTILNLLLRFYDPENGTIRIDGEDIRHYSMSSLRDQMSIVLQEPLLFGLTVHENIAFGRPRAVREKVLEAAVKAQADEFIRELPQGYDTVIAERGVSLSGGQKQRIAIARAVLRRSPILLLDEPHTGLDAQTEADVTEALSRLMQGRTTFVIAHRLATVRNADRILFLHKGKLVAHGTHQELFARVDGYRQLCALQFGAERQHRVTETEPRILRLAEEAGA